MDDSIKNKNLIPGSEQLTRPEEIDYLKKFLRKGIEDRDSKLSLGKDNLMVPNKDDPSIKKVDNLDNRRISVDGKEELVLSTRRDEINSQTLDKLEYKSEKISSNSLDKLDDRISTLNNREDLELGNTLDIISPEQIESLSSNILSIGDTRNSKLEDTILPISHKDSLDLESSKETISHKDSLDLESNKETISYREDLELSNNIESLDKKSEVNSLSDFLSTFSPKNDVQLSYGDTTTISQKPLESLDNNESISGPNENVISTLPIDSNKIDPSEVENLNPLLEELVDDRNIELKNTVEIIEKESEIELSQEIDKINQRENLELTDELLVINKQDDISLDNSSILIKSKDTNLSSELIKLKGKNDEALTDKIIVTEKPEDITLSNKEEYISKTQDLDLESKEIIITKEKDIDLNTRIDSIKSEDTKSLGNDRVNITPTEDINLSEGVKSILKSQDKELVTTKETIKESSINSLSDFIDQVSVSGENSIKSDIIPSNKGIDNKSTQLENAGKISDLRGYTFDFSNNQEYEGQISRPMNPSSRFKELDSMLGVFTNPFSSEGISQDKNPEGTIASTKSSGGDIIFSSSEVIKNNDSDITSKGDYKRNYIPEGNAILLEKIINTNLQKDKNVDTLGNEVINLDGTKDIEVLGNKTDDIVVNDINSLSESKKDIIIEDNIKLSEEKSTIEEKKLDWNNYKDLSSHNSSPIGSLLSPEDGVTYYGGYNKSYYNELMKYLGTDDLSVAEKYQLTIDELKSFGNWGAKVSSYLGAILSKNSKFLSVVPERDVDNFKKIINSGLVAIGNGEINSLYSEGNKDTIEEKDVNIIDESKPIEPYKLPDFNINGNSLNPQAYLRMAAEQTVGGIGAGASKQLLIDKTLALLVRIRDKQERATGGNRDRLPGNDNLIGGLIRNGITTRSLGQLASGVIGSALSDPQINPINRPDKDGNNPRNSEGKTVWSTKKGSDKEVSFLGKMKNSLLGNNKVGDYTFSDEYINTSGGMATTLEDLCGFQGEVSNVEEFRKLLDNSKYITTASNVTGTSNNKGRVMTLDSNHIWEVKFMPYVGSLNGNKSWLPSIAEINTINMMNHGIDTNWTEWIPFTSFELQSRKMTQKSLGLYDGEISYPISMEFTNELRMTIADDSYKSWKSYFERCAECSVYLSRVHDKDYYDSKYIDSADLTPIVRTSIHPGLYKNLAFRCVIYVMSPQLSTIRKFDFLVVLKDFTVDYQGETDSSAGDLTLSFSIVGENPKDRIELTTSKDSSPRTDFNRKTDYSTILSKGVSSALKLL